MQPDADCFATNIPDPPRLLAALQRLTGLSGCFHDYLGGALTGVLGQSALNHFCSFCSLVKRKSAGGERACVACDSGMVQSRLGDSQRCFVKQCHAGACELVVLMQHSGSPAGALFVGPFRWPPEEPLPDHALVQPAGRSRHRAVEPAFAGLPEVAPARLRDIAALARLLAAHVERCLSAQGAPGDTEGRGYEQRIRDFLSAQSGRPVRLGDLARQLFLSESRTSQLVREHFDTTFPRLLLQYRLKRAKALLAGSHLTVASVARSVGFDDASYFHRAFKHHAGTTPAEYRRTHWRGGDEMSV
ncbi:MAG: helix-turn-helix domain-containing protein [Chitinivibrionales bacterium]|nr:helix-turn-helix domain-containing protein [Chitinivibrionales bacterium]